MSDPWTDDPGDRPPLVSSTPWGPTGGGRGTALAPGPPHGGAGARQDEPYDPYLDGPRRSGGPSPRAWLITVAVLSAALLVAVAALVWTNRSDDEVAATPEPSRRTTTTRGVPAPSIPNRPAPTTPPSTAPSAPPTTTLPTGPPPAQAELEAELDTLIPFVERTRGLTFTARPQVAVVANAEIDAQITAEAEAGAEPLRRQGLALQAFGVIDTRTDLAGTWRTVAAVGQLIRYDPGTKRIGVRPAPLTPYSRGQLVGALVNALDDQRFGIARPQYNAEVDELRWTFASVVAGDARRVTEAWLATLPDTDRTAYGRAERQARSEFDATRQAPAVVPLITASPEVGSTFMARLAANTPPVADQAFVEPPRASMHLLHPERYVAKEAPVAVPKPQANGPELGDGILGESVTSGVLQAVVPAAQSIRAADGWTGDRFVLWRGDGGNPCIRVDYRTRTEDDLNELNEAWLSWSEENPGAEIVVKDGVLSVTRCAGGVSGRSPA